MKYAASMCVRDMRPSHSAWLVNSSGSFGAGVAEHASLWGMSCAQSTSIVRVAPVDCLRMDDSSSTTASNADGWKLCSRS